MISETKMIFFKIKYLKKPSSIAERSLVPLIEASKFLLTQMKLEFFVFYPVYSIFTLLVKYI